ncbi:MAG: TlpA disulfide reductase family protein [Acidobacteriota bacterium]
MKKLVHPATPFLAVVCAFLLGFAGLPGQATARIGHMPKDGVARQQLRPFNGNSVSLSSLRGQVVVLDFFATWCGHSRLHVPTVRRLADDEGPRGTQVIGLAVEERDSTVQQFIKDQHITYPVATVSDPVFGGFVESRDVSVPQTLVYGRDGRLAGHFVGHSAEQDAELVATVKRELDKH